MPLPFSALLTFVVACTPPRIAAKLDTLAPPAVVLPAVSTDDRASFVTTLGRDTVVLESVARSARHLDGDLVVRIPTTVLLHYSADMAPDGSIARTVLEQKSLGGPVHEPRRVQLDFAGDSVKITIDSAGRARTVAGSIENGAAPFYMTGFGSSYGLYSSLGMYELFLPRIPSRANDTVRVQGVSMGSGVVTKRRFVRRSATIVDADYFGIAWTHLIVDASGHIVSADARGTTEQTETQRTAYIDVERAARAYVVADRAGHSLGVASPNLIERGSIGGQLVVATYGSPRRRSRTILGNVVPYDRVWRTGANEVTTLIFDHDLTIGGAAVPAGSYSLWTLPHADGSVQLIINRQHGQWGTEYDPAQDLVRVPMQVSSVPAPREEFAVSLQGTGSRGALRISWDNFVWSVPVAAK